MLKAVPVYFFSNLCNNLFVSRYQRWHSLRVANIHESLKHYFNWMRQLNYSSNPLMFLIAVPLVLCLSMVCSRNYRYGKIANQTYKLPVSFHGDICHGFVPCCFFHYLLNSTCQSSVKYLTQTTLWNYHFYCHLHVGRSVISILVYLFVFRCGEDLLTIFKESL